MSSSALSPEAEEAVTHLNKAETPKWREMRDMLLEKIKRLDEETPKLLAELKSVSESSFQRSLIIAFSAVILGILRAGVLLARIARQARQTESIVSTVAGGNLSEVIRAGGHDEFGAILTRVAMLRNR